MGLLDVTCCQCWCSRALGELPFMACSGELIGIHWVSMVTYMILLHIILQPGLEQISKRHREMPYLRRFPFCKYSCQHHRGAYSITPTTHHLSVYLCASCFAMGKATSVDSFGKERVLKKPSLEDTLESGVNSLADLLGAKPKPKTKTKQTPS